MVFLHKKQNIDCSDETKSGTEGVWVLSGVPSFSALGLRSDPPSEHAQATTALPCRLRCTLVGLRAAYSVPYLKISTEC